jgi:hypothetical protein
MPSLSLWLLACYGLTFLLADSTILSRPRAWITTRSTWFKELFECHFCLGVWVSLGLWVTLAWPPKLADWRSALLYVFAGASATYVVDRLVTLAEAYHACAQLEVVRTITTAAAQTNPDDLIEEASKQIDDQAG